MEQKKEVPFSDFSQVQTTDLEEVLFCFLDDLAILYKESHSALGDGIFNYLYQKIISCRDAKGKIHYHFENRKDV